MQGLDHRERVLGLIAQQVQEVFPEAVKQEENGYLSVNYSDMVPVLIQAVKQLANQQKESEGDLVAMRMTLHDVIVWLSIRKKIGDYEEDENKMAVARLDGYKQRQLQALNYDPNERQALVNQISELRIKIEEFDSKVKPGTSALYDLFVRSLTSSAQDIRWADGIPFNVPSIRRGPPRYSLLW